MPCKHALQAADGSRRLSASGVASGCRAMIRAGSSLPRSAVRWLRAITGTAATIAGTALAASRMLLRLGLAVLLCR